MTTDPYRYFRIEARELLNELMKSAFELEAGGQNREPIAKLLRAAHTLKGAARVVKQPDIADHAHKVEGTLEPFRESSEPLTAETIDELLRLLDGIRAGIEGLDNPPPSKTPSSADDSPAHLEVGAHEARSVRADVDEIESLLDGLAETRAHLGALRHGLDLVRDARAVYDRPQDLHIAVDALEMHLTTSVERMDRELRELRTTAERLRLVSVEPMLIDLERAARDVARSQGKSISFHGEGVAMRLDAHVLSMVQSALAQIVRNAVAHGIESGDERRAAGKPGEGHVTVGVMRHGDKVVLICQDDGRGIDFDAVRAAVARQGGDASTLDARALTELLLRGGVSTSAHVSELSGRGIGLDLARDITTQLGGTIDLSTETGVGTTVTMTVPLSLAGLDVLIIDAAHQPVVIPLDAVRSTARAGAEQLAQSEQGETLIYEGEAFAFAPIDALMGTPEAGTHSPETWSMVVVDSVAGAAAIGTSRILGTGSITVHPMPPLLPVTPLVSGAWFDADGNPQLVLEPDELIAAVTRHRPSAASSAAPQPILVIDDSLTTRMLEQSILEAAGYDVDIASSAEEALSKAAEQTYSLFLVDVEMPGMDGYGFIRHAKATSELKKIPCILVTSKASPQDRQRGFDAGADAFIAKGEFDQGVLLDRIEELTST